MAPDGIRVLVVEDHAFQRRSIVNLLHAVGVRDIGEAANGLEALALLEADRARSPPDVILCDLEMPEMDGVEFLRAVAERKLARSVAIVSGREPEILWSVETMVRASGLSVVGQLKKPLTLESLRQLLARGFTDASTQRGDLHAAVDVADLRRALAAGEFHAEFQPKVSLATGALVGVEALARWRSRGVVVTPAAFIPVIIRERGMDVLTGQMLDSACQALRAWAAHDLTPQVSVNVSAEIFANLETADRFTTQVRQRGIDPQRVTLEVTETEVIADLTSVLNVMARLRLKGFGLAIDDFGVGYSSLAQLSAIPFTELKIDQLFVRRCDRSPRLQDIVHSSIALARRLGIRTVAEGVESPGEWEFLRSAGCDEAQGFYIARAMPADQIPAWADRRARLLATGA